MEFGPAGPNPLSPLDANPPRVCHIFLSRRALDHVAIDALGNTPGVVRDRFGERERRFRGSTFDLRYGGGRRLVGAAWNSRSSAILR